MAVVAVVTVATTAVAADASLTITARVVGSVLLTTEAFGQTTSGAGTTTIPVSTPSIDNPPGGFTIAHDASRSTLSTVIKVRAQKANMPNNNYALFAQLQRPLADGVVCRVNGVVLSDTSPTVVTSAGFGTTQSLQVEIAASSSTSRFDNAIVFTVSPK